MYLSDDFRLSKNGQNLVIKSIFNILMDKTLYFQGIDYK